MEFENVFNNYLEFVKYYRKHGTYVYYKKNFSLLTKALKGIGITNTDQLKINSYDLLIRWIKEHTIKKNSKTNDCLATLTTALNYNDIPIVYKVIKLNDDTTPFKILNDEELGLLKKHLKSLDINESNNLNWIAAIFLALDTGARKNELLNIKTKNVDLINNTIYLETTKTDNRRVNFGKLSLKYIKLLFNKKNEYLLNNYISKEQMSRRSIEFFIGKLNRELNFYSGNITLHRFRKTLATKLFISGMPLASIQKLLGHSDIKMTMRYIEVSNLILDQHYKEFYPY